MKRLLPSIVSVIIITIAAVVLYRTLSAIEPAQVAASFRALPASALVLAGLFAAGALASLATYEVVMLRELRPGLPWRRPALVGLIAYPIGHAVGFGALSGGAIRYRLYQPLGLGPLEVGKVIVLSALPYAAGLGVLCAVALVAEADAVSPRLNLSVAGAVAIGAALLATHAAYVVAVLRLRGPLKLRWFEAELPGPRLTAFQYALGLAEVLSAAAVLYVLLPEGSTGGFLAFVGLYVVAILAGVLSSVPAGLGVFESVLLLTLRDVPAEALLGAVLAYRLLYELLPFLLGLALFLGWELLARRR
ncbi:MAG: hypothetical protein MUC71_05510 [Steroidobacteraceae bacterium]|jgi:uncharacterized membrane protein YbhN (UPF0104 family)|nr:hypothetical protein [Steroidobacteraceae bacterium]